MRQRPKVTTEVYLLDVGTKVMPSGLEKSKLYQNGQVKTAFKIDMHLNEMEYQELIENEFVDLLNLNAPRPR